MSKIWDEQKDGSARLGVGDDPVQDDPLFSLTKNRDRRTPTLAQMTAF
jgi:hypothetical protein